MALFRRSIPAGLLIGFAAGLAAREIAPALSAVVRPLAKTTLKSGMVAWEKLKEMVATAGESFEDLTSEVQSEMSSSGTEFATPVAKTGNKGETDEPVVPRSTRRKAVDRNESRQVS